GMFGAPRAAPLLTLSLLELEGFLSGLASHQLRLLGRDFDAQQVLQILGSGHIVHACTQAGQLSADPGRDFLALLKSQVLIDRSPLLAAGEALEHGPFEDESTAFKYDASASLTDPAEPVAFLATGAVNRGSLRGKKPPARRP